MRAARLRQIVCVSIIFIFKFSIFNSAHAQQWWTGWSQQTSLALCIHLSDSTYELYSPLQTSDPIPVSKWSLRNDTLRLNCGSIGLKMTLVRQDSLWVGNWRQGILKEDITFHPADTLYHLRRPQTPQPPYRFDEETVSVDYTDSQGNLIHLEGTLTYPKGGGKYPTLLLVSGSGQQNRDEELFFHRPFLVLADYLASRGIAVLRYDDRGVGASTGPVDSADTHLFAEDAEALFNTLKTNPHVDPSHLGIGGHSEGGAIAPIVASRNKDVRFVVMLAGQGSTGLDVLLQQNEALYFRVSQKLLAVRTACMRDLFNLAIISNHSATQSPSHSVTLKDYQAVILRHTEGLSPEQIDSIGLKKGVAYSFKQQMDTRWMRTFLTLDPADYLPKVSCPLLALNGENDLQVLCGPNLTRIHQLCPQALCIPVSRNNHLFQRCQTGSPDEYVQIEETIYPWVMETIADWILGI